MPERKKSCQAKARRRLSSAPDSSCASCRTLTCRKSMRSPANQGLATGTLVASRVHANCQESTLVRRYLKSVFALAPLAVILFVRPTAASAQWGYPYPYLAPAEASLRLDVKPRDAQVYVDGYYAGLVDNFDGTFQRLHVFPGQHEIVIYKEGYRSVRER